MNKKWILITILIMTLIFFFSSQNGEQSSYTSGIFTTIFISLFPLIKRETASFFIRKCAHFTIFGCLGFSFYHALEKKTTYIPLLLSFLYACSDEIHQSFTAARSCQFSDVLLDTSGAFLFIFLAYVYIRKKSR